MRPDAERSVMHLCFRFRERRSRRHRRQRQSETLTGDAP
jgi:hypothetical protein